jgi:predicted O-methyltransferase YrrM
MASKDRFLRAVEAEWGAQDPAVAERPLSDRFDEILTVTQGMATANKLALLNAAAGALDDDERYVEVGTYRGTSVIGAALGHPSKRFVAVDNFSEFGGPIEACRQNLARFTTGNVELINDDAWTVLATPRLANIGVFFYDGRHTFGDQWRAFEAVEPHLAPRALVIVDDTHHRQVAAACRLYTSNDARYELLVEYDSPYNGEPRWWNGVQVYWFDRDAGAKAPTRPVRRLAAELWWGLGYESWRALRRRKTYLLLRKRARRLGRRLRRRR